MDSFFTLFTMCDHMLIFRENRFPVWTSLHLCVPVITPVQGWSLIYELSNTQSWWKERNQWIWTLSTFITQLLILLCSFVNFCLKKSKGISEKTQNIAGKVQMAFTRRPPWTPSSWWIPHTLEHDCSSEGERIKSHQYTESGSASHRRKHITELKNQKPFNWWWGISFQHTRISGAAGQAQQISRGDKSQSGQCLLNMDTKEGGLAG